MILLCLRPRGRSGLKFDVKHNNIIKTGSPSSRAEWVEIASRPSLESQTRSPSSRAEWVEMPEMRTEIYGVMSPSSRAEWVEIASRALMNFCVSVSVLAGGVG